jgi:hypothetical protein
MLQGLRAGGAGEARAGSLVELWALVDNAKALRDTCHYTGVGGGGGAGPHGDQ